MCNIPCRECASAAVNNKKGIKMKFEKFLKKTINSIKRKRYTKENITLDVIEEWVIFGEESLFKLERRAIPADCTESQMHFRKIRIVKIYNEMIQEILKGCQNNKVLLKLICDYCMSNYKPVGYEPADYRRIIRLNIDILFSQVYVVAEKMHYLNEHQGLNENMDIIKKLYGITNDGI